MQLFQLFDHDTNDILGLVNAMTNTQTHLEVEEEITESWEDFNKLEEHDLDSSNVDDFVQWHNENWGSQIERVYTTEIGGSYDN